MVGLVLECGFQIGHFLAKELCGGGFQDGYRLFFFTQYVGQGERGLVF